MSETLTREDFDILERRIAYLSNQVIGLNTVLAYLVIESITTDSIDDTKVNINRLVEILERSKQDISNQEELKGRFNEGLFEATNSTITMLQNYQKRLEQEIKNDE